MALNSTFSFENATGTIDYPFTNDFIFRAVLQRNNQVLTALIRSLLHLTDDDIHVEITNPIELGEKFTDKDFILDIRVIINHSQVIDLEMQLSNDHLAGTLHLLCAPQFRPAKCRRRLFRSSSSPQYRLSGFYIIPGTS